MVRQEERRIPSHTLPLLPAISAVLELPMAVVLLVPSQRWLRSANLKLVSWHFLVAVVFVEFAMSPWCLFIGPVSPACLFC